MPMLSAASGFRAPAVMLAARAVCVELDQALDRSGEACLSLASGGEHTHKTMCLLTSWMSCAPAVRLDWFGDITTG